MSWSVEAIAVPKAVNRKAIKNIENKTIGNIISLKWNPIKNDIAKTIAPWIVATVAPPKVLPIIISKRDTGATSVSFKNPNCLSQMISIPAKIAVNRMLIETIPGTRNSI